MNNQKSKQSSVFSYGGLNLYLLVFIITYIIYIVIYKNKWQDDQRSVQMAMTVALFTIAAVAILKGYQKNLDTRQLITLIILAGFVMRIGYMIYTHPYVRYHDVCGFSADSTGHDGYIYNLIHSGNLPNSNHYQGYHPPFYHILSAILIRFTTPILGYEELSGGQVISCIASCYSLLIIRSITKELDLGHKAMIIVMAFMAFLPSFYIIGGTVNNDSVMWFCFFTAILYTIRWYQAPSYRNIIFLAIAIGLGMMTKISCGMIALFTGSTMLIVLGKRIKVAYQGNWQETIKQKSILTIIGQLSSFAAICFPLALWYPIRNYLLFNQSFMHVSEMPPTHDLYVGHIDKISRFFSFPISAFTHNLYSVPVDDYNLPTYVVKGGIFGEYTYDIPDFIPAFLLFINILVVFLSIYAMVDTVLNNKVVSKMVRYGMPSVWTILFGSFLMFNIRYPFGCTMDYRYIVPCALCGAIFIGVFYEKMHARLSKVTTVVCHLISTLTILFCTLSIVMYLYIA